MEPIKITQIQHEFINFKLNKKLVKLTKKHFTSYIANTNITKKIKKFIKKESNTIVQCFNWIRLNELEKNPQYYKYLPLNSYNPISKWEYQNVIKTSMMYCFAKMIGFIQNILNDNDNNIKNIKKTYKLEKLAAGYTNYVNTKYKLASRISKISNDIYYKKNKYIIYKNYKFNIDDRIQFLIDKTDVNIVLCMLLRYCGIGIDAMHCSLPYEVYKYMYDEFDVRGEGYSSPLNSKLLELKGTKICTAFYDTDKYFGAIGRFNKQILIDNQHFNWSVNPPYTKPIIQHTFNEIVDAIDEIKNKDFIVFFLIPKADISDEFYYNTIIKHKYVQKYIEPDVGTHLMNCNGTLTHMNKTINALFFISKNTKYKNIDINQLMHIWNDPKNDPRKCQSFFTSPQYKTTCDTKKYNIINDNVYNEYIQTNLPPNMRKYIKKTVKEYVIKKTLT